MCLSQADEYRSRQAMLEALQLRFSLVGGTWSIYCFIRGRHALKILQNFITSLSNKKNCLNCRAF